MKGEKGRATELSGEGLVVFPSHPQQENGPDSLRTIIIGLTVIARSRSFHCHDCKVLGRLLQLQFMMTMVLFCLEEPAPACFLVL